MKKVSEPVEDMTVILSIHDVIPTLEDDIIKTYDRLTDLGISSFTLLVTPFYQMKKTNSFTKGSLFNEFLLSLGVEISLHGYSHFTKSGSMAEFSDITTARALIRLRDGVSLFKKGFNQKPIGFIPPLWEGPPRVVKAAKQIGFEYCTLGSHIFRLSDSKVFSTATPIISQGGRSVKIESAMLEMELGGALQIGIHPKDYSMNNLFELLADLRDNQGYHFTSYSGYLTGAKR
ncbi:DUF2334 domain-containing protein [Candidatus Thorarchaeota archaeon]|nr:MAG: DUF2334 domain-containing protein [Candidatus Thorarchaeota archaeon]